MREKAFEVIDYIGTMSGDWLQMQYLFLHRTKSKYVDVIESKEYKSVKLMRV